MSKSATGSARIDESVKSEAEESFQQLDIKLQHSYEQAMARQGRPLEDVFADLEKKHE